MPNRQTANTIPIAFPTVILGPQPTATLCKHTSAINMGTTYLYISNENRLFEKWRKKASSLLNERIFGTYNGALTPYEKRRYYLCEEMKGYFIDQVESKWSMDPNSKALLLSAYSVVNWYELVDVLMEEVRVPMAAEDKTQPETNVVPITAYTSNRKRSNSNQSMPGSHS